MMVPLSCKCTLLRTYILVLSLINEKVATKVSKIYYHQVSNIMCTKRGFNARVPRALIYEFLILRSCHGLEIIAENI